MAAIQLKEIAKTFKTDRGNVAALTDINLDVPDGQLLVIVGPSGCGKTTLLKLITGVETPTSGQIIMDDRDITSIPSKERDISLCFQTPALYPHLTVEENICLGLELKGASRSQARKKARWAGELAHIDDLLARKPKELSGGQRQRAALARAIARDPKVILLDEPLSSLDAQLRTTMRAEIKRLQQETGVTMIYVTHDQLEAMTLADEIVVMKSGRILQKDPPAQVYQQPAELFIAQFIGNPAANILPGHITSDGTSATLETPLHTELITLTTSMRGQRDTLIAVRPEDVEIDYPRNGGTPATVELVELIGDSTLVHLQAGTNRLIARCPGNFNAPPRSQVSLRLRSSNHPVFDSDTGVRLNACAQNS